MGIILSEHGIGPTEGKIRAVPSKVRTSWDWLSSAPDLFQILQQWLNLKKQSTLSKRGKVSVEETTGASFPKAETEPCRSLNAGLLWHKRVHKVTTDSNPVGLGAVLVQEV